MDVSYPALSTSVPQVGAECAKPVAVEWNPGTWRLRRVAGTLGVGRLGSLLEVAPRALVWRCAHAAWAHGGGLGSGGRRCAPSAFWAVVRAADQAAGLGVSGGSLLYGASRSPA